MNKPRALIRLPHASNRGRDAKSRVVSIPSPVGGWNARDSLAAMRETDAVKLENWFPTPFDVMLRLGFDDHATGLPAQAESLMSYNSPTTKSLFCASSTSFYDVTSAGAVGAAVVTGLTNARWQHVNISTAGGNFLYAVNGSDKPRVYDGATWTAVDAASTPAITGVTTTNLIHVNLFKTRLWFVEKDSLKIWYLPVNSIGGAAASIDFMSIARRGGFLMAMGTWTIDAGEGLDDHAVFVTSEGEVIVYRGTDPSSATTWALVGVWYIGSPIGRRCLMKYAGDLLLITLAGVLPMSRALISAQTQPDAALTNKIQDAMNSASRSYAANFGWQLAFFAKAPMLILNVPVAEGSGQEQYVMNTISGSWAKFTGIAANCWEIHNDKAYFGGNQGVYEFWEDENDNGANIDSIAAQAYNYFGARGQRKRFLQARPILVTEGSPAVTFGVNVDYQDGDPAGTLSFSAPNYAVWGVSLWGVGLWGTSNIVRADWQGITGVGMCASPRMKVSSQDISVRWRATDLVFEPGGVI